MEVNVDIKFKQLEKEIAPYNAMMSKAADAILQQDVSSYPIFVVHQQLIDIGLPIVDNDKTSSKWSISASTLEEFVTKQIVQMEKVDDFKKVYKNPENNLCLFILSDLGATFVFVPRK